MVQDGMNPFIALLIRVDLNTKKNNLPLDRDCWSITIYKNAIAPV